MNLTVSVWLVIALAFLAANLPFLMNRVIVLGFFLARPKTLWMRLLELVVLYFLVGWLARLLERNAGQTVAQDWEFYAITAPLFLTFAFPGFIYCYLLCPKKPQKASKNFSTLAVQPDELNASFNADGAMADDDVSTFAAVKVRANEGS